MESGRHATDWGRTRQLKQGKSVLAPLEVRPYNCRPSSTGSAREQTIKEFLEHILCMR
jgi:hypothetical protein